MASITKFGYQRDTLQQIIADLKAQFRLIYGADLELGSTSPDGQMIEIFSNSIATVQELLQDWVLAANIDSSTGNILSELVAYKNSKRLAASKSTVDLTIASTAPNMAFPANLIFIDAKSQRWVVDSAFSTNALGVAIVTAEAPDYGKVTTPANSITSILTPTFGFASVTNTAAAVVGRDEENDYQVKLRLKQMGGGTGQGMLDNVYDAVREVDGVQACYPYENDTNADKFITPDYKVPAHTLGICVYGGAIDDIARAIYLAKSTGCGTGIYETATNLLEANNISNTVISSNNLSFTINFSRPVTDSIDLQLELPIGQSIDSDTQTKILTALQDFANASQLGAAISHIDIIKYIYESVGYFFIKESSIKTSAGVYSSTITSDVMTKFIGTGCTLTIINT